MKKNTYFVSAVLFIIMLMLPAASLQAERLVTMEDVTRPFMMSINGDRLFIVDGTSVLIYSMKDYKLIKKFGKAGEGPGEFMVNYRGGPGMMVFPTTEKLVVNTDNKLFLFSREGEFLSEVRAPVFTAFMPLTNGYAANGFAADEKQNRVLTVNLHDLQLNKVKGLYVSNRALNTSVWKDLPKNPFYFVTYKNRIYVMAVKEGFCIIVFDNTGKELYRIKKDEPRMSVTNEFKKRALYWGEHESNFKEFFDKSRFTFRKHFPAMQEMAVDSDRIYAFTFKIKDGNTECIIMDLKGKELKRVFLPMPYKTPIGYTLPSTFDNHKFYRLLDNEDEESWELHVVDVK